MPKEFTQPEMGYYYTPECREIEQCVQSYSW